MPKKGKHLGEVERARLTVIPDLYAIYSQYFSEALIDTIAKQCNYEMDLCLSTLAEMVQDGAGAQQATVIPAKPASNNPAASRNASTSAASATSTPAVASSPPPPPPDKKKGILRLQHLKAAQPPSVWKREQGPVKATQQPWMGKDGWAGPSNAADDASTILPAADDAIHAEEEEGEFLAAEEEAYGSDANDESLCTRPGYAYTGFESPPYYTMEPGLLEETPVVVDLPTIPVGEVLDPTTPSAKRGQQPARTTPQGILPASPAHPHHHLHALYLQLGSHEPVQPVQKKASMFTARPASAQDAVSASSSTQQRSASAASSIQSQDSLTPAQASKLAETERQAELARKKEQREWMRKHEQEKREVRKHAYTVGLSSHAEEEPAPAMQDVLSEAVSSPTATVAPSIPSTEPETLEDGELDPSSLPADIPIMAPLTRAESQASFERVKAAPQELEGLLSGLFPELDPEVIRAVVESMLASVPTTSGATGAPDQQRDVAQEACDTLLEILAEQEEEAQRRLDAVIAMEQQVQEESVSNAPATRRMGKAHPKVSSPPGPFVPSAHQLTDEELALKMSLDPSFDPNAVAPVDANVGFIHAKEQHQQQQQVAPKKNKRGHTILPRGTANAWAMKGPAGSLNIVAPDLSAQWKLSALLKTFPTVEREVVDEAFAMNSFQFEPTKAHLRALFPDATCIESVRPAPVDQPWSQKSVHHSKVSSTSRADAERGQIKSGSEWDNSSSSGGGGGANSAVSELTDAELESALGPVLDGRAASFSSSSNLRAQASHHARRRAAYISAAVGAFTRGKSGLASELASKGQDAARALASTSARAGIEIFVATNSGKDCTRSVDLHGLHVAEALRVVPFILRRRFAGNAPGPREITFVTGVGHHSQGGIRGAKLGPALIEYLKRAAYNYSSAREGEIKVFQR